MRETLVKTEEFKDSPVGRIPKDWNIQSLKNIATVTVAYVGATDPYYCGSDTGILFLRTGNITEKGIDLSDVRYVTKLFHEKTRKSSLLPGDVVVSRVGITGIAAVIPLSLGEVNCANMIIIRCSDSLLPQFLRRLFSWEGFSLQIRGFTAGSVQPVFNIALVERLLVPLPSKSEQSRIAEVIDTLDEAIAHTSSVIAKLKQMKAGLLHDLLTRGLDEKGELRDATQQPEQFKDSPLGQIPQDWEVAPLKAKQNPGFAYIKTGPFGSTLKGEHWVEEGIPVITIGSIGEREFIKSEVLFISEAKARSLSAYAVKEGDLVFSRVADVGRSVVVSAAEDGWIMSSNLMRISLDRTLVNPTFGYLNIVHNEITRQQIRKFVNSGGREIANTAILDNLQFCWASKEEQNSITQVASIYDSRIRAEQAYRDKLKLQKQGLMHDLLTGKVRVKDVDKFTPASDTV